MNTATIQQQTSPLEDLMKESLTQAFKELKEGKARPIDEMFDELSYSELSTLTPKVVLSNFRG